MNVKLKLVPGFSNYAVSADGRLWSTNFAGSKTSPWTPLKSNIDDDGYCIAKLWKQGKVTVKKLHRLVYTLWVGPIPTGHTINHKDTNKGNNAYCNLEPLSHVDNMKHAWANGCFKNLRRGETSPNAKFMESDVLQIRELYAAGGISMKALAQQFNTQSSTICEIVNRKTWKHV